MVCGKRRRRWESGGKSAGLCCSKKCGGILRTRRAAERARHEQKGLNSLLSFVKRQVERDLRRQQRTQERESVDLSMALGEWAWAWNRPLRERRKRKQSRPTGSRKHRSRCRRRGLPYENWIDVEAVYIMDAGVCQLCGHDVVREYDCRNPLSATIDHVVPLNYEHNTTHGHQITNVQLAHMKCNSKKSNTLEHPSHLDALDPRSAAQRTRVESGRRMFAHPPRLGRAGAMKEAPMPHATAEIISERLSEK